MRRFGALPGVLLGAGLFAVYHLDFAPASLIYKLRMGAILGAARGRDRSLVAPALAHFCNWAVIGAY
jgi:membrane protease YdiL (CAAX protease family)